MDKKELWKIASMVLICIAVLVVLENAIRGTKQVTQTIAHKVEDKKAQKEYISSEEYEEETMLEGIIAQIEGYLISGDFDTLYRLAREDYLDFSFQKSKEAFQKYMAEYTKGMVSLALRDYYQYGDCYYTTCILSKEENSFPVNYILEIQKEEDVVSYQVVLENFQELEAVKAGSSHQNLSLQVLYVATKENELQYLVELQNLSKKEITFRILDAYVTQTNGTSYLAKVPEDAPEITLKPQETNRYTLSFYDKTIKDFPIESIHIGVSYDNQSSEADTFAILLNSR